MNKQDLLKAIRQEQEKLSKLTVTSNYNLNHPDVKKQSQVIDKMCVQYHKMKG